jgi:hypothetical protein
MSIFQLKRITYRNGEEKATTLATQGNVGIGPGTGYDQHPVARITLHARKTRYDLLIPVGDIDGVIERLKTQKRHIADQKRDLSRSDPDTLLLALATAKQLLADAESTLAVRRAAENNAMKRYYTTSKALSDLREQQAPPLDIEHAEHAMRVATMTWAHAQDDFYNAFIHHKGMLTLVDEANDTWMQWHREQHQRETPMDDKNPHGRKDETDEAPAT